MTQLLLTNKIVREVTCPDGETRVSYFDTLLTGFVLEVRKSGGKTFFVRYRDGSGAQKRINIGASPLFSADDARKQAQGLLKSIALGETPSPIRSISPTAPTLGVFIADRYMPFIRGYKRSVRADDSYIRNHILPKLGGILLDQITEQHIIDLYAKIRESKLATGTTNRIIIILRYIFNLAIKWKLPGVTQNPTAVIRLPDPNNARERYLNREEVSQLCGALTTSKSKILKNVILLLILTGARKHEVLEARWQDFNLEQRFWRIPRTKSGKSRFVPISDTVLEVLAEIPRNGDSQYIFPSAKQTDNPVRIDGSWDVARKQAGLDDLRVHDLRHSFASFLINSGRSLYEVQQILGHSSARMTQRYAHLAPSTLLAASNCAAVAAGINLRSTASD